MSKDMVKNPDHYCFSNYEPKDVIREWGLNFNLGSAVKYIARAGRKDDIVQDLKKAKEFLSFEIEALEAERRKSTSKVETPDHLNCRCMFTKLECRVDLEAIDPKGVSLRVVFPNDMPPEMAQRIFHKEIDKLFGGKLKCRY